MTDKKSILLEADQIINGERHDAYGAAEIAFQRYAAGWSAIIGFQVSPQQVAMCMIWLKMMRELNKPSEDNRRDIAGYTGLLDQLSLSSLHEAVTPHNPSVEMRVS